MQGDGKGDGEQRRRVASDPVGQGRGDGERAARRQTQTAVAFDVRVRRQQARAQPARGADGAGGRDVPAAGVEAVRAVGERDGHHEPDAPRRHRQQLRVDRRVPEPLDDRRCEEGEGTLRNDVGDLWGEQPSVRVCVQEFGSNWVLVSPLMLDRGREQEGGKRKKGGLHRRCNA